MRVLIWDTGYFLDIALLLAARGNTVDYYVDWVAPHPELVDWAPGYGFTEIRKLRTLSADLEDYDLIMFPDVGFGGIADSLREEGYPVFGASELGERLELDRVFMHETLTRLGIPRPETRIVHGLEELKQAVDELGGGYVKISTWRGDFETFYAENGDAAQAIIDESGLGPLKHALTFIVEEPVAGVEIGCDCMFNGDRFLTPYQYGVEVKDQLNASVFTDYSPWSQVLDRLAPALAAMGYAGQISLEGILTEDGEVKILDVTARFPFPAAGLYMGVENLEEVLLAVAEGRNASLEYAGRGGVEIVVATELADKWLPLTVDADKGVMLKYAVKVGGQLYHVPAPVVAGAVGIANDLDTAYRDAAAAADSIDCPKCYNGKQAWSKFQRVRAVVEAYA